MNNPKVFICHWHKHYRNALRSILSQYEQQVNIVGEAAEYPECMEWFEQPENEADFLLIGFPSYITKPGQVLNEIRSNYSSAKVITISMFDIDQLTQYYENYGATAHFSSTDNIDTLIEILLN